MTTIIVVYSHLSDQAKIFRLIQSMATNSENTFGRFFAYLRNSVDNLVDKIVPQKTARQLQIEKIKDVFVANNSRINQKYPDLSMKKVSVALIHDLSLIVQWQLLVKSLINDPKNAERVIKQADLRGYNILTGYSDPNKVKKDRQVDKSELFRSIIVTSIDYYLTSPQNIEILSLLINLRDELTDQTGRVLRLSQN